MGERLSIDALRREPCFLDLTDKQKRLIEIFLKTGNKLKAVQAAYDCKSERSAKVMTYTFFAKPCIVTCLAVANGADAQLEVFKETVRRAVSDRKLTIAQLGALKLFVQTHGYLATVPEPEAGDQQKFAIGSVIVQDGKRYRVTAEEME